MIDTTNMSREVLERAIEFARAKRDLDRWNDVYVQNWQKCIDGLEAMLAEKDAR